MDLSEMLPLDTKMSVVFPRPDAPADAMNPFTASVDSPAADIERGSWSVPTVGTVKPKKISRGRIGEIGLAAPLKFRCAGEERPSDVGGENFLPRIGSLGDLQFQPSFSERNFDVDGEATPARRIWHPYMSADLGALAVEASLERLAA